MKWSEQWKVPLWLQSKSSYGLKNGQTLYLIECWNSEEHFYKLGITSHTLYCRFGTKSGNNKKIPYNMEAIGAYVLPFDLALSFERLAERSFRRYYPKKHFRGHLECFKITSRIDRVFIEYCLEHRLELEDCLNE